MTKFDPKNKKALHEEREGLNVLSQKDLLHQHHLFGFSIVICGHSIEVDARGDIVAGRVLTIPFDPLVTCRQVFINESDDFLTKDIVNIDSGLGGSRKSEVDRR